MYLGPFSSRILGIHLTILMNILLNSLQEFSAIGKELGMTYPYYSLSDNAIYIRLIKTANRETFSLPTHNYN